MGKLAGVALPLAFAASVAHGQTTVPATSTSSKPPAAASTTAAGSGPAKPEHFKLSAELEAAPSFAGKSLFDLSRDRSDDSEYSASFKITSPLYAGDQPFFAQFGATWSPRRFQKRLLATDVTAPSSSAFVEIGYGDSYSKISHYASACRMMRGVRRPGEIRPYFKYRFTENYSEFFGAHKDRTNEATAGLRIRDLRYTGEECGPNPNGDARKPAFNYEWRGDVVRTWTGDPADETMTYSARAEILSRPAYAGIKVFGRGRIDRTVFSYAIAPATKARRDWRYRLAAGVNLTSVVKKLGNFSLEVEAREEWRRSTDLTKNRNQFQLVGTLDWGFE